MLKKKQGLALLIAFLMLVSMIPGTTFAADTVSGLWVATTGDDANPGTEAQPFATIKAAIAAASPGDTIHVAAGEYIEAGQIVIEKNLSIIGADTATTIIRPDTDQTNWILINNNPATRFVLSNVTLDGQGHNIRAAIRTSGSGSITNSIIRNIRFSQYNGWGIAIEYSAHGQIWDISGNSFINIERVGILVDGQGNQATVSGNLFSGKGNGDWVEYGIEVGDGANAIITGNTITGYRGVASSDGSTSAGVFVHSYFGPNAVATITDNSIRNNSSGICAGYLTYHTITVTIHRNDISANTTCGVESSGVLVDATNNWWGDASGPRHATANPMGLGNAVSDNVTFSPWLFKVLYTGEQYLFDTAENVILEATVSNTDGSLLQEGATVEFFLNNVSVGTATTDTDGLAVLDAGMRPAGPYIVHVVATMDAAGTAAAAETSSGFIVVSFSVDANNLTHAYDDNYNTSANIFTPAGYIIYNIEEIGLAPAMAGSIIMNAADGSATTGRIEFLDRSGMVLFGLMPALTGFKPVYDFIVPAGTVYMKIYGLPLTALYIYEIEEDTGPVGPARSLDASNQEHAYDDNYNTSANIFSADGYLIYSLADLGLAAGTDAMITMSASDGGTNPVRIQFLDAGFMPIGGVMPLMSGLKNAYVFSIPASTVHIKIFGLPVPPAALYIYEIEPNTIVPGPARIADANNREHAFDDNYGTSANIFSAAGYLIYSLAELGLTPGMTARITLNAADGSINPVRIEFLDGTFTSFDGRMPLVTGYRNAYTFRIPMNTVYIKIYGLSMAPVPLYIFEIEEDTAVPGPVAYADANNLVDAYDDNYNTSANIFSMYGYVLYRIADLGLTPGMTASLILNASDGGANSLRVEFQDVNFMLLSGEIRPISGWKQAYAFVVPAGAVYVKIYGLFDRALYLYEIEESTGPAGPALSSNANNMEHAYDGNINTSGNIFTRGRLHHLQPCGFRPYGRCRQHIHHECGRRRICRRADRVPEPDIFDLFWHHVRHHGIQRRLHRGNTGRNRLCESFWIACSSALYL